ncbi:MAG: hypothetical protein P1Q69_18960 [Candidatus Thorarchaeota archaeon]|nr:hypothetical protein [Candidatus Thorarchaeota archaeon]
MIFSYISDTVNYFKIEKEEHPFKDFTLPSPPEKHFDKYIRIAEDSLLRAFQKFWTNKSEFLQYCEESYINYHRAIKELGYDEDPNDFIRGWKNITICMSLFTLAVASGNTGLAAKYAEEAKLRLDTVQINPEFAEDIEIQNFIQVQKNALNFIIAYGKASAITKDASSGLIDTEAAFENFQKVLAEEKTLEVSIATYNAGKTYSAFWTMMTNYCLFDIAKTISDRVEEDLIKDLQTEAKEHYSNLESSLQIF